MATKSFWLSKDLDEDKLDSVARKNKSSVSKIINKLLKENYDVFKERKK